MISDSIVDDEKGLRESFTTFVGGSPGFRCLSAYGSAEAALEGLPAGKPDVVLRSNRISHRARRRCSIAWRKV
jgi:DNA-binding NarL/FixJ family response regulator